MIRVKLLDLPTFLRRAKCFEAAEILKIPSLRDASANDILDKKDLFAHDEIMYKRFKHVVSEIHRTVKGAEALRQKDYPLFGKFMVESHYSLKYVVFFISIILSNYTLQKQEVYA